MVQQAHSQLRFPVKFEPYQGDLMGLCVNENYLVFRWKNPDCKILFSVCQRGKAANCHFASDKAGLRFLKQAIGDFCDFVFWIFDWCTMVMAIIERSSVARLCEKSGFNHAIDVEGKKVYVRQRDGRHSQ